MNPQNQRSNRRRKKYLLAILSMVLLQISWVNAQENPGDFLAKDIRRIYIPEDQLGAIIHQDKYGAILSMQEYEQLLTEAIKNGESPVGKGKGASLHAANYNVKIDGERLVGELVIQFSSLGQNWNEVSLDVTGWNVQSATLNDQPPSMTRDGELSNTLRVFVGRPGQYELKLGISTPLHANGSDKSASFHFVQNSPGQFQITLPAGKYLESTQVTVERPAQTDQVAEYTFPIGGIQQLALTITDRQQSARSDVLTFASTAMGLKVLPSEITWAAKTELQVFGQEIDRLSCFIPNSLEITAVESTGLESWELADAPDDNTKTQITLLYRQGFEGRREINFRGILTQSPEEPWNVPTLTISNVTSHTGVILVEHPENLRLQAIEFAGVRASDVIQPNPAASPTAQAHYQIWDENFSLGFIAGLKEQELQAAMTNILDVRTASLNLYTTISVESRLTPLFEFRLRLPSEWEVTTVQVNNTNSPWQTVSDEAGINELRIPMNPPLPPGQTRSILLFSRTIPDAWPIKDQTARISIPEVRLPQVDMIEALYGISVDDDFDLVTQQVTGLDPAGQSEIELLNQKLQALGKSVRLAFTYQDTLFSGQLDVSRKPAALSAENITFFRVDPERLFTRLESILNITGGGYRELEILVTESAGENLRFQLIPLMQQQGSRIVRLVEQLPGDVEDGNRRWTLRFDQYLQGQYRLTTEASLPRGEETSFSPIRWKFPDSEVVSGHIAIEGSPEEHIKIEASDAEENPLAVVDPVDFPEALYHSRDRVVAGFRYIHPNWQLSVSTTEFDRSAVPTAIGHSAKLTSVISNAGEFQHQANVRFTAVGAQSLLVTLPKDATLWSTLINGTPVEIRKSPEGIQVPLSGLGQEQHSLQMSYSTKAPEIDSMGELSTTPPAIKVVNGQGDQQPLEMLSHDWELYVPDETLLISSEGRFNPLENLFGNTIFSQGIHLLEFPSAENSLKRGYALLIPLFVFAIVWLGRSTSRLRNRSVKHQSHNKAWLMIGLFAATLCLFVVMVVLVGSKQRYLTSGNALQMDQMAATGVPLATMEMVELEEEQIDAVHNFGRGIEIQNQSDGVSINGVVLDAESDAPQMAGEKADAEPARRRFRVPVTESAIETAPQESQTQTKREEAPNSGLFSPSPTLNLTDRDNWPSNTIVGLGSKESFATPNDVPFRQGSFDLAAPSFGGFDPNMNQPGNGITPFGSTEPDFESPQAQAQPATAPSGQAEFSNELSLDIRQTQTIEGMQTQVDDSTILGRQSSRGRRMAMGGLLSMTFQLQIPEGSQPQRFHYQGNGLETEQLELRVRFANRTTGRILIWSVAIGIMLLGWWLRNASPAKRVFWVGLTILMPVAVAWVVPVLWQLILQGLLFGGLSSLALWIIRWCCMCCQDCCIRLATPTALVLITLGIHGQSQAAEPVPQVPPPVQRPVNFVVVPFQSLEEIDNANRVWVPHHLYKQMWEGAHPEDRPAVDGPVPGTISEANYVAQIKQVGEEHQVAIQARWVVSALTDKSIDIVLPVVGTAVENVTINGAEAALQGINKGRIKVAIKGRGVHIVDGKLSIPANVNGDVGEFTLDRLPVASGVFTFELPQSKNNLRVRVNGLEKVYQRSVVDNKTLIATPLDRGGRMVLSWYPESQQGGQNQIVQVETAIIASINDTGLSVNHAFQARVRQGALNDLTFSVPDGLSVREIQGADVGGWELKETDNSKELRIFFRREVTDYTDLHVNMFQPLAIGSAPTQLSVATITPVGVTRETMQLSLRAASHLRTRVTSTSGLNQVDLSSFQPVVSPQAVEEKSLYSYRSSSRPIELNTSVERQAAEAQTEIEQAVHVGRRKQLIATRIAWQLTGSPRRQVDVAIPDDYLPISVICAEASDWYVQESESGKQLTIEFASPRLGRIEAGLEGHRPKQPDDNNVEIALPQPIDANAKSSTLGIWLDAGYQAVIAQTGDWKATPPGQLSANYRKLDSRPVQFAFRSDVEPPDNVVLDVQTATPKLTADGVTLIAVSDATIDYGMTLRWNISQAATEDFSFTIPNWLSNVEVTGAGIRELTSEDAGNDRTRWKISLIDPVHNEYLLNVAATIPAPTDQLVQTPSVEFDSATAGGDYQPLQVQQQFALLVNLSPNQLNPVDLEQFDSVSVDRLPLTIHDELVQQAMEITRVRNGKIPSWSIQRLEEHEVAKAVVLAAHLETVLEVDGSWRTLATYGIRNRGRQFLALRLPEGSRLLSVFVRENPSRSVVTTINEQTVHLIALPQTSAVDLSFDVEVLLAGRFDRPLAAEFALRGKKFTLPTPAVLTQNESAEFGMPVTQTLWTVHVPEEVSAKAVTGVSSTNLTPHATEAWLAAEQQMLQRLKADVSEMARIVADKSASKVRRSYAKNNLKNIGLKLENFNAEYAKNSVEGRESVQLREQLFNDNRVLQQAAEQAQSIIEPELVEADDLVSKSGRVFILENNDALNKSNSVQGVPGIDINGNGIIDNFNFYSGEAKELAQQQQAVQQKGKALETRSRLKSQIRGQSIVNGQAPVNGVTIFNNAFDSNFNDVSGSNANAQGGISGTFANGTSFGGGGGGFGGGGATGADFGGLVDTLATSNAALGEEARGEVETQPWSSTGGLSIKMELPKNAKTLSFSKVGGSPTLTLNVLPARSQQYIWGLIWCVVTLAVGLRVLRAFRDAASTLDRVRLVLNIAVFAGLLGFFILVSPISWTCFWLFFLCGLARILLSATSSDVIAAT